MQLDQAGIDFIKQFEGFSPMVYDDVAGRPTIGYGHLIEPGETFATPMSEADAEALLVKDVGPVVDALNKLVPSDCTQNQFNALCSFGYNLGVGALKAMLRHGWGQVPFQMPLWCRAGGEVVAGLQRRRTAEVRLFIS